MSERMTSIALPGVYGSGIAERGRKTPAEMIQRYRAYAESQRDLYAAILNSFDADYRIITYVGVHVTRNKEVLQEGRAKASPLTAVTEQMEK